MDLLNRLYATRRKSDEENYTICSYIEATGQQTIDTEILPTVGTEIECKLSLKIISGITSQINGITGSPAEVGVNNGRFAFGYVNSIARTNYYIGIADQNIDSGVAIGTNKISTVRIAANGQYSVNSTVKKTAVVPINSFGSVWLGSRHVLSKTPPNLDTPCYEKIYAFKAYHNGVLIADMLPAYNKRTGEIGMYDTIRKKFFHNLTDTPFLKGADVAQISNR